MTTLDNNNLKRALIQAFEEELQEIETTSAKVPHDFSDAFLTRMDSVTKMSNHKYSTIFSRRIRRSSIGAIAAMLILCMSITVYAVIKNIPFNISNNPDDSYNIVIEGDTSEDIQQSFHYVTPKTPEGFHVKEKEEQPLGQTIIYENTGGETIIYSQVFAEGGHADLNVPSSTSYDIIEETINGRNAIITQHYGVDIYSIIIEDGTSVFTIVGSGDYSVLYGIALEVTSID